MIRNQNRREVFVALFLQPNRSGMICLAGDSEEIYFEGGFYLSEMHK